MKRAAVTLSALCLMLSSCTADKPAPAEHATTQAAPGPAPEFRLVAFDSCDDLLRDLRAAAQEAVGPWGFINQQPGVFALNGTVEDSARGAVPKAAAGDATILIRGESGTGKGVLARAIHARSLRASGPFVTVHCPSLSAELLESELFGHVRGAFTGAVRDTEGKAAAAAGGTLFLDEVGELPLPLQAKLLRLLQEKRYERVGETRTRAADVRILAASNRHLEEAVAAGIDRVFALPEARLAEMGAAGHARVSGITWDHVIDTLTESLA